MAYKRFTEAGLTFILHSRYMYVGTTQTPVQPPAYWNLLNCLDMFPENIRLNFLSNLNWVSITRLTEIAFFVLSPDFICGTLLLTVRIPYLVKMCRCEWVFVAGIVVSWTDWMIVAWSQLKLLGSEQRAGCYCWGSCRLGRSWGIPIRNLSLLQPH